MKCSQCNEPANIICPECKEPVCPKCQAEKPCAATDWITLELHFKKDQWGVLLQSLKVHCDLLELAREEKLTAKELSAIVQTHDKCNTLLYVIKSKLEAEK